ncbi:hypothetical protein TNCV_1913571 [Trichonephila clavipes]|nr:hypothetical protein TNCV_1913571 [Trichonephila clavipes]
MKTEVGAPYTSSSRTTIARCSSNDIPFNKGEFQDVKINFRLCDFPFASHSPLFLDFTINLTPLIEAGWSNRRIGRHLGHMVVARCWQQWITEGRVYRRGGSGRPRNTNDREDRAIRRVATSAPTTSLFNATYLLPDIQCHQEKP